MLFLAGVICFNGFLFDDVAHYCLSAYRTNLHEINGSKVLFHFTVGVSLLNVEREIDDCEATVTAYMYTCLNTNRRQISKNNLPSKVIILNVLV